MRARETNDVLGRETRMRDVGVGVSRLSAMRRGVCCAVEMAGDGRGSTGMCARVAL